MARKVIPLVDWELVHGYPTTGQLRWLVFHSSDNGFDSVVRRCGRRVLIDEAAFFDWLDLQSEEQSRVGL
jgi:hypothetical protein